MRSQVALIWAQAHDASGRGVIGAKGDIPWHLPEDFAHFKQLTSGHPIIMGRNTWDSLPRKPLPNRTNIVASRSLALRDSALPAARGRRMTEGECGYTRHPAALEQGSQDLENPDMLVARDLPEAIALGAQAPGGEVVWVIGGAQIYGQAMEFATRLEVTEIDLIVEGDTFAPAIPARFSPVNTGEWLTSTNGTRYRFVTFVAKDGVNP